MDAPQALEQHDFSGASPLEVLKYDHQRIRQLFDRYLNAQDKEVRKDAGTELILALEHHADLEEAVFYPTVRKLDPTLIDRSEREHLEARQLIAEIKNIDITHPQCEQLFRQLADAVLFHIDKEEQLLFLKVQQSGIDLDALRSEMQSYLSTSASKHTKSSHMAGWRQ